MITRYVITHMSEDGLRVIFGAAQGRNTYETREEAQKACDEYKPSAEARGFTGLEVRPVECWPVHFDPKRTVFED